MMKLVRVLESDCKKCFMNNERGNCVVSFLNYHIVMYL